MASANERAAEAAALKGELRDTIERSMTLQWMDPRTLTPNAFNWKKHPKHQRKAFSEFYDEVGWTGALLWNRRTNHLLDGHMRQEDAIERNEAEVPVLVIDVDDKTEKRILALYDKIGGLYSEDEKAVETLAAEADIENAFLKGVLLGDRDEDDEETDEDDDAAGKGKKDLKLPPGGLSMVLSQPVNYVVLIFKNEVDWTAAQDHFGIQRQMCPFTHSVGIGRVVDGAKYLHRILETNADHIRALDSAAREDAEFRDSVRE